MGCGRQPALGAFLGGLALALGACGEEQDPSRAPADRPGDPASGSASAAPGERVDDLRALGYAGTGEALADPSAVGVLLHDPGRAATGATLITYSHACRAEIVDPDGALRHAWSSPTCDRWDNAVLLPDGDLLVVGRDSGHSATEDELGGSYLLRLGWDGSLRWKTPAAVHHDAELAPDGEILALTARLEPIPAVDPEHPTYDHALARFSSAGEPRGQRSLFQIFSSAPGLFRLQPIPARRKNQVVAVDLFHSNSVETLRRPELAERSPLYRPGNVLLCLRHQDTLAIVEPEGGELLWAFGQGELSGPHDATLLENGHVLAFDNGLERGWSRVVEVDPLRSAIVWEYRAEPREEFFSLTRGAAQRLANGNTLVTHSHGGRVLEVTPGKDVVWLYQTPYLTEKGEPSIIVRARRLEGLAFEELERRRQAGIALPASD